MTACCRPRRGGEVGRRSPTPRHGGLIRQPAHGTDGGGGGFPAGPGFPKSGSAGRTGRAGRCGRTRRGARPVVPPGAAGTARGSGRWWGGAGCSMQAVAVCGAGVVWRSRVCAGCRASVRGPPVGRCVGGRLAGPSVGPLPGLVSGPCRASARAPAGRRRLPAGGGRGRGDGRGCDTPRRTAAPHEGEGEPRRGPGPLSCRRRGPVLAAACGPSP